jgi:DNA processing protein
VRAAAAKCGQTILTPADAAYPDAWRWAPLRPLALFVRGETQALTARPAAAFVGSRTPTPYGIEAAADLAMTLARAGMCLWSGLARGVDAAAHRACVAMQTRTVAVLAGGLDDVYPPEHRELADRIVAFGGCLISELAPGRRATRGHFPRRNRLLAMGTPTVVVVEAGLASGALQTARLAAEWGAAVYALPGPWRSERSQGCHRLLQEGAGVIESPETLLRDLGVGVTNDGPAALRLAHSADEAALLRQLDEGPRPCGLVQRESGLDREAFYRALFALEQAGVVVRGDGDLLAYAPRRG